MADIQLSPQLFKDIQEAVGRQEPNADQGVVMQYLAATMGYMLGTQRAMSKDDREDFFEQLCAFSKQVMDDLAGEQEQQKHAQASAFGYWNPPKK